MSSGKDSGWQTLEEAKTRLQVSVGHLRRLCLNRLQKEGKARMVSGRGVRPFWMIRDNVTHKRQRSGADLPAVRQPVQVRPGAIPVQISIGDLTITIQTGAPAPSPRPARA